MTDGEIDRLAIELTYSDGEQRLLMGRWHLKDHAETFPRNMFEVVAKCGCSSDIATVQPCERHRSAVAYRVIDVTAPSGRRVPIR